MTVRSGLGFDLHPLVDGRPLILGGVTVPAERGLGGHSDADVLTHAVCEALLGRWRSEISDGCSRTPIRATKEPRASGCCGR